MRKRIHSALLVATLAGCSDATGPAPTDLIAGRIILDGPGVVFPGDSLQVRVLSYARSSLPQWPMRLYLSTNVVVSAEDIAAGDLAAVPETTTVSWALAQTAGWARVPLGTPTGRYYLGVMLDPDAQLADTTRENNIAIAAVRVGVAMTPSDVAQAPAPLSPPDHAEFTVTPPALSLAWSPVAQATSYHVEVDYCPAVTSEATWWSSCTGWWIWIETLQLGSPLDFSFYAPGPGRWRVRGVDANGFGGPASAWQAFRFH